MKPVEVSGAHCDIGLTLECLRVCVFGMKHDCNRNIMLLMMLIVKQLLIRFELEACGFAFAFKVGGHK